VRWFPLGTVHDLALPAGLAAERQSLVASQREKLCFFAGSIKRNRAQLKTELEHVRTVPPSPFFLLPTCCGYSLPLFLFIFFIYV
jgi:hypothetical protein